MDLDDDSHGAYTRISAGGAAMIGTRQTAVFQFALISENGGTAEQRLWADWDGCYYWQ